MPKYFYTAKSFKGEIKSGFLEAKDETELARSLRQEGYVLVSSETQEKEAEKKSLTFSFSSKVSLTEKLLFTRNLQVMIRAGISLPRSLRLLSRQAKNKKFGKILEAIADEISTGKNFSSCLGKYPEIFSEIFVNMVKVGEESGTLDEVLKTLTNQLAREHELSSKVRGAMVYPAVVLTAMLGVGALMLVMVVPKLAETFRDMNVELPASTKLVMALGSFLEKKWWLGILIIVGLAIPLSRFLKTKLGKRMVDIVAFKFPLISPIVIKTNSASTTRTLSSLITAGVPIVSALGIVAGALNNSFFRTAISAAAEQVGKGVKLSEALMPYQNVYPSMVVQMIEVGEETGQTAEILAELADFYEEEVTNATKNLSTVIEPLLMIIIGAAVGFFAISMVQPMYSVLDTI
ncbi:MAG: hypothetical protein COT34_01385 [Candidatus Nealsonbacteria bacterium CG08_land_8_20_14_0_20_43_11]|uniref:Type II secretion system protein GspF domain-containing protein n=1 Tax=Candidatus Nealsonbacteria bacterium CG08_land_8_20_14_0_20_43_11 TaxID=1974706 RepID=A0A2M6T128_9BACT|nr:MAG: hypothetical protein COT34_01385 [Candidatus Nealsonbacteria bacterium CG08_land_8_20_14_0_20_43_11]